jgi:hypothetical protein
MNTQVLKPKTHSTRQLKPQQHPSSRAVSPCSAALICTTDFQSIAPLPGLSNRIHTPSHFPLPTSHFSLPTSHLPPPTSHFSLPTSHLSLLTSHFSLPTSNFQLPTSNFPLPTSHFPLPTSHFPVPTSHFPLLTSHFPLLTSHFQLPTSHLPFCSRPSVHLAPPPGPQSNGLDFLVLRMLWRTRSPLKRLEPIMPGERSMAIGR